MPRLPLTSGAYQSRSLLAGAQRSVNLYPEQAPPDSQAPVPVTHFTTPGLTLLSTPPTVDVGRGAYRCGNGDLYVVIGATVYYVDAVWSFTAVGTIPFRITPVSMSDNGLVLVIVDGTSSGYCVNLSTKVLGTITGAAFYGADRVDYIDTYFVFNRPGTTQFYISASNASYAQLTGGTAFDSLDIAGKTGQSDTLVACAVVHRELWLIGALSSEVWVNSGSADFTFQVLPGAFVEHGCAAKYSIAVQDSTAFWLAQDRQGKGIVVKTEGYAARRISTHAIEADIQRYSRIDDAIGGCYQIDGHAFYVLTFPSADVTWCVELQTGQWHQWAYSDNNGDLHRHRGMAWAFAYNTNVVLDWQNGQIYQLDGDTFTDAGNPIIRIRTFPHLIDDDNRVMYKSFTADIQVGTLENSIATDPPQVSLRWSDDRGASYGSPVLQSLGAAGEYKTSIQWNRLGYARDRVFELSWSVPARVSLNGAFIDTVSAKT